MLVNVLLFAGLAQRAGTCELTIELLENATVSDLLGSVAKNHPALDSLLPTCFVSINQEYAALDRRISPTDEIAILPPVSGGEDQRFLVTDQPLQIEHLMKLVSSPHAGAILTFTGTVREFTQGQRTLSLSYEAYIPMAVQKMKQIAEEIHERWAEIQVAMHHRIGDVAIEEIAVIIAVSSPHRNDAFEAGRYAIERLKQIVPIWKKEMWEDGSEWKGHQQGPWNPLAHVDSAEPDEGK